MGDEAKGRTSRRARQGGLSSLLRAALLLQAATGGIPLIAQTRYADAGRDVRPDDRDRVGLLVVASKHGAGGQPYPSMHQSSDGYCG
jgi:hypothetical protein